MARILIVGCGYVGEAAANAFHEQGWQVEGWTASEESAAKLSTRPYPVHAVDVSDRSAAKERSGEFDVVLHCVSSRGGGEDQYRRLYLEGAKNLLQVFPGATLIFTSSTSVYPQSDGSLVDETSAAEPSHEKGKILREAEKVVLAGGGIVTRLAGIHGPKRSFFLTRFLEEGVPNDSDRFINQVHRDDIVSALLLLAEARAEVRGEIFNVVGDQPIKAREAYAWLESRLRKPGGIPGNTAAQPHAEDVAPRPVPPKKGTVRAGKRGAGNKHVSNEKLRALGWRPRYPTFESAMSENILSSFGF